MFWQTALPLMEKQNVTQAIISAATGKPFSTVHSWIKRKCPPQADCALKIADLLGVSVRFLVTGKNDVELAPREKELLQLCSVLKDDKFKIVLEVAKTMYKDWEATRSPVSGSQDSREA